MTYVMSDLHGCWQQFNEMLRLIQFSENDHLYILGDVVDRGPDPIALLQQVIIMVKAGSVTMLLGNHELWMLEHLLWGDPLVKKEWYHNGGQTTMEEFRVLPREDKLAIRDFLKSLPPHLELEVNGQRFYLVHGYPGDNLLDEVWNRMGALSANPVKDAITIVGHTPTAFIDHTQLYAGMEIIHQPGIINIDCGSVCVDNGKLACLRLEDMGEFYVNC